MDIDSQYLIKKLNGRECRELRPLWEEVFSEDSEEFTDYYFRYKAGRNTAYTVCQKQGAILELKVAEGRGESYLSEQNYLAMLHLSPYPVMIKIQDKFTEKRLHYIVGVATRQVHRGQGMMKRLLTKALYDLYQKEEAFTFLMPADPDIYRPFEFHYIYDRPEFTIKESFPGEELQLVKDADLENVINYVNLNLAEDYQLFIKRNREYYQVLKEELSAQNGGIYVNYNENSGDNADTKITGCCLYTGEKDKPWIQEAFGKENSDEDFPVKRIGKNKPIIMARIVNIKSMISCVRTKKGVIEMNVRITDGVIAENNGLWYFTIAHDKARANKIREKDKGGGCLNTTISKLTAFIFGYEKAESCFEFEGENKTKAVELFSRLENVITFSRVCLNEIV